MARLLVPVHYPLTDRSKRTLTAAVSIACERDAEMTVLHVNLYQNGRRVSQGDLRTTVEPVLGGVKAEYVVRTGFLLEETIIDEAVGEDADIVVVGQFPRSRWRRLLRRFLPTPDVEAALENRLDCTVIGVAA